MTLEHLAGLENAPALSKLKERSAQRNWPGRRQEFRDRIGTKARELAVTGIAEVRTRQARLGRVLQGLSAKGAAHVDAQKLTPNEIAALARTGAELERKALGIEELKINFGDLSDEDVNRIADGEDPEKVLRRRG